MKHIFAIQFIAACAVFMGASTSFAHVVLQDGAAAAGTRYGATKGLNSPAALLDVLDIHAAGEHAH
jgi:uncharacterized protein YcnI